MKTRWFRLGYKLMIFKSKVNKYKYKLSVLLPVSLSCKLE